MNIVLRVRKLGGGVLGVTLPKNVVDVKKLSVGDLIQVEIGNVYYNEEVKETYPELIPPEDEELEREEDYRVDNYESEYGEPKRKKRFLFK